MNRAPFSFPAVRSLLFVLSFGLVAATAASAQQSISGTVRSAATGSPLAFVDIDVFDASGAAVAIDGTPAGRIKTGPAGAYTAPLPGPGSYRLRADPTARQRYGAMFYAGVGAAAVARKSVAQPIVVVAAQAVTAIDIALPVGVVVSGVVTASGLPAAGIDIDVFAMTGPGTGEFLSAYPGKSGPGGVYSVGALPPGLYTLRVDPTMAQGYARTYYPNAGSPAAAMPIAIVPGGPVAGIDFSLDVGGSLSGTIRTAAGATPLAGIDLDVLDATLRLTRHTATTDVQGGYRIGAMKAGVYSVRADPSALQGYARQYYSGAIAPSSASPVTITSGIDRPGVDFALVQGGSISGTLFDPQVQPALGVDLDLYDAVSGSRLRKTARSSLVDGTYRFDALVPGSYKVRADATLAQGFALLYYDAQRTKATANSVSVAGGVTTPVIDFRLAAAGSIGGVVRSAATLGPLAGVRLDVFDANSTLALDQGALSAVDGSYTLVGLDPGTYLVRAVPAPGVPYAQTYYGGTAGPSGAGVVGVAAGQTTSAIDIALPEPEPAVLAAVALCVLGLLARRGAAGAPESGAGIERGAA